MAGEVDVSVPAALLADPARARLVCALLDGRALPASMLASEAGVAASTASGHLSRLLASGMVEVERHGRHRYYRIADPRVVAAVEALAHLAPTTPVRSMRQGTRAEQLRRGRLCYDHLAGRLGVWVMASLIAQEAVTGGDGRHHPDTPTDRLSAPGHDVDYRLTASGEGLLDVIGVDVSALAARRRPLVRYCLDWTEQRHHLAGAVGAAIADRCLDLGWVRHTRVPRALTLTDQGHAGLSEWLGGYPDLALDRAPPRGAGTHRHTAAAPAP